MKNTLLILTVSLFSTFCFAALPFEHMKTGISLPDTLAGMARGEVKSYESGVAIPYHGKEVEVTIFIRKLDPKIITSSAMIVEESLATVKQLEASGTYSNVKLFKSTDDSATSGWAKGAFSAQANQSLIISLIYATIRGEHAIKARITTANLKNDSIQKFVEEFQKIVNEAQPKE